MTRGTLEWMKSGHSYVAYLGEVTLTVKQVPARFDKTRPWRVHEVMGHHYFEGWRTNYPTREEAQAAALRIARLLAAEVLEALATLDRD